MPRLIRPSAIARLTSRGLLTATIAVTAAAMGCKDSEATAKLTATAAHSSLVRVTASELHRRNPLDWVGANHNEIMRQVSQAMREGKVTRGDACATLQYVAELHPELWGAPGKRLTPAAASQAARNGCVNARHGLKRGAANIRFAPAGGRRYARMAGALQSSDADELLSEVDGLIDDYTTPDDFATALAPILDAAASLPDSTDQWLVEASVSVAQSSMDYWMDSANQGDESSSFSDAYSACGDGTSDPMSDCLGMSSEPLLSNWAMRGRSGRPHVVLAAMPASCPGTNWVEIGHVDFAGAVVGGAAGVVGGPAGVAMGAVSVAGAGSAAEAWWQLGVHLWCLWY